MPEQNTKEVAPGTEPQNPAQPTTPATLPKLELKDGKTLLDGKSYVKESDLIAAKENLQKQLESAQQAHNEAVDKLKLEASAAQQEVAKANAALDEAKKARDTGAISKDELAKVKKEADDAKAALVAAGTSGLDYRRKYIMAVYNIPANSEIGKGLESKTAAQLDSLEEALKALGNSRGGPGNYAAGGGGGSATPMTALDRAKAVIEGTPFRGVRNEAPANK